jgi:N-acetylneuraminic acid mutarotase
MYNIRVLSLVGLLGILVMASSCSKTNANPSIGNWTQREDFGGTGRSEAAAFVVGTSAYVTTGLDFSGITNKPYAQDTLGYYYDLWQYTPDASTDYTKPGNWNGSGGVQTQLDSFPGPARSGAVAFTIGDTGYVGTGYNSSNQYLSDFYAYVPSTNTWVQEASFIGSPRADAVGFALGGKGYITTGFNGTYNSDCYQYDPATGQWKKVQAFPGTKCSEAVAFVSHDTTAYICTGSNNGNTSTCNQLWAMEVSPSSPNGITWTEKRHISNFDTQSFDDLYAMIRQNAVAFVMGDFAYLTTGNNGAERVDTWEYDIKNDLWYQETSFEGPAREGAVAFSINMNGVDRGFITTGRSGPSPNAQLSDTWEWFPLQPYNAIY